mmetsp:Transcript_30247/g.63227  ORF Transcript_30247/g.63227 Transcript_30247/m.63227 type:complete len:110 (-) Transcript_30247:214-543(-)
MVSDCARAAHQAPTEACHKRIDGKETRAEGKTWHPECFRCVRCGEVPWLPAACSRSLYQSGRGRGRGRGQGGAPDLPRVPKSHQGGGAEHSGRQGGQVSRTVLCLCRMW